MIEAAQYNDRVITPMKILAIVGMTLAIIGLVSAVGVTINQTLAIIFSMVVATIWFHDKFAGSLAGILLYVTKSFWVRLAYMFDIGLFGDSGFDLLGITPALILAALTIFELYARFSAGEKLCPDRTRKLLAFFVIVNFLSILNPTSSLTIGLGGFERNILPNMTMLYLLATVMSEKKHFVILVKTFLILGIISCIYAIGQYLAGLYPWEIDYFRKTALDEGLSGYLTIGLRGIEFRIFSLFYGYMDFFFSNVLIFALAMTHKEGLTGRWKQFRVIYIILWIVILVLSIERMPLVMTLSILIVLRFMKSSAGKRRKIIWRSILITGGLYGTIFIAGPFLISTGADKLIRLAELANPFAATSINDRAETKWGPSLETIKGNPLGVGIGYGSLTKASKEASKSTFFALPHNELLQKTLETGYLGGVLYILLFAALFKDYLRIAKIGTANVALGLAMVAGTISYWLCGLVNLPFSGASGLVYWSLAGAALAAKRQETGETSDYQTGNNTDKNGSELMQIETRVTVTSGLSNEK